MFRISIVEDHSQRKLILEGKLIAPWTVEVERVWRSAVEQLHGRKLVIDLKDVTHISVDGENTLFELMKDGAKFSSADVLTKYTLRRLARRKRTRP